MNRHYIALLILLAIQSIIATQNEMAYKICLERLVHKGARVALLDQKTRRSLEQSIEAAGEVVDEEKLFQMALIITRFLLSHQNQEQIVATCRRLQQHPSATEENSQ